jgi:hypothetical protein
MTEEKLEKTMVIIYFLAGSACPTRLIAES